jgi:hypothetical protein
MRSRIVLLLILTLLFLYTEISTSNGTPSKSDTLNIEIGRIPGAFPQLGFACELEIGPLKNLFATPGLISDLKEMNANISLALIDLSQERAEVVQQLNNAGIPVIAWLALPREQGYYMNASNSTEAIARFANFEKWTNKYNLKWAGVGLDIEPNFAEFVTLKKSSRWKLISTILDRSMSLKRLSQSQKARVVYTGLIKKIEDHGYPVQTYQLSFIGDERKVHSTLLDRVIGVVSAKGKTEAMMIYSSFNHNFGSAQVWSYGPDAQAIVVGITGKGADTTSKFVPLNWEELSRDLIVASHFTNTIGIFSLEGCVQQGFLPLLKNFDWNQKVILSGESIEKVAHFRKVIQIAIWTVTNLLYFIALIVIFILWRLWCRHRRKTPS